METAIRESKMYGFILETAIMYGFKMYGFKMYGFISSWKCMGSNGNSYGVHYLLDYLLVHIILQDPTTIDLLIYLL